MRLSDRGMAPTSAPRRRQDLRTGLQMLLQPRHQLDQVAGPEAAVELPFENIVPAVAAGAGRAGQGEEIGAAGDPAGGPALDGRGLDLLVGEHAEQLAEALDLLLVDLAEGLGRDVAAGHAVEITNSGGLLVTHSGPSRTEAARIPSSRFSSCFHSPMQ